MRFADILRLSLSALYQQKARTLLTTLGVLFGTFVLIFSLSLGQGVQETIVREYQRYAGLRQIEVYPKYESSPSEKVEVPGEMSEEKRERLRQQILRQGPRDPERVEGVRLTPDQLQRLREIAHVKAVVPSVFLNGRVIFNQKVEQVSMHSALPDHPGLRARIVAGEFLRAADGDAVVVTEYLLYRLGIVDDAAVRRVLGQKLRFDYQTGTSKPHLLLTLLGAGRPKVALEEQELLDKVLRQLPAALDQLDLTPAEKEVLKQTLRPPPTPKRWPEGVTITREFTIVGVLRSAVEDEKRRFHDWWMDMVDLVLPIQTAVDLFFEVPNHRDTGIDRLLLEADSSEHVKAISREVASLGLRAHSLVELIEREQFTYLLLFAVMNCIAAVALLVAALGIVNTMLMAVLERTREIGVMKAVGARNRHVQMIFLFEGALIGLVGGLIGLLAGWAVSFPADAWVRALIQERMEHVKLEASLFVWPAWLVLSGPFFAGLVTTLAAVYPARRAARVNPITALRHE